VNRRNQICAWPPYLRRLPVNQMTALRCKHPDDYIPTSLSRAGIRRRGIGTPLDSGIAIFAVAESRHLPESRQQNMLPMDRDALAARAFSAHR